MDCDFYRRRAPPLFIISTLVIIYVSYCNGYSIQAGIKNGTVKAMFIFGDSTVDPGNNNYIDTVVKSNFLPYGIGYKNQQPTGRFSDGKLPTDFIASYLGIKDSIPPYLDPTLSLDDMITGVSFASAGSGFDPLTSTINSVISMSRQLEYFAEYKSKLERLVGKKRAEEIVATAAYGVSCGTNDVVESRVMSLRTDLGYQRYLLHLCNKFIQGLADLGAQNIFVVGLPPVGCIPMIITLNIPLEAPLGPRECVGYLSAMADDYNKKLKYELKSLETKLQARRKRQIIIVYVDIYQMIYDQIQNPKKYGYVMIDRGCCGTGLLEVAVLCHSDASICVNRTEYLFWDSMYPSEKAYYNVILASQPFIKDIVHQVYGHV